MIEEDEMTGYDVTISYEQCSKFKQQRLMESGGLVCEEVRC